MNISSCLIHGIDPNAYILPKYHPDSMIIVYLKQLKNVIPDVRNVVALAPISAIHVILLTYTSEYLV
jgi:hypothetical protein